MKQATRRQPAVVIACLLSPLAAGEEDVPMEHVFVTAPLHKTAAETALPVTVLTGDELRDKAKNTIGETLSMEPGIASPSSGPVSRPPRVGDPERHRDPRRLQCHC